MVYVNENGHFMSRSKSSASKDGFAMVYIYRNDRLQPCLVIKSYLYDLTAYSRATRCISYSVK